MRVNMEMKSSKVARNQLGIVYTFVIDFIGHIK